MPSKVNNGGKLQAFDPKTVKFIGEGKTKEKKETSFNEKVGSDKTQNSKNEIVIHLTNDFKIVGYSINKEGAPIFDTLEKAVRYLKINKTFRKVKKDD